MKIALYLCGNAIVDGRYGDIRCHDDGSHDGWHCTEFITGWHCTVVLEIENGGGHNARFVYFCCLTRSVWVFPLEI